MADDPSSFAMSLVVGLGEGTKLFIWSATSNVAFWRSPAVGGDTLSVLAETLGMDVSMAVPGRETPASFT